MGKCTLVFVMLLIVSGNIRANAKIDSGRTQRQDSLILARQGSLVWALDEHTAPDLQSIYFDDSYGILYFFNAITRNIDALDAESGQKTELVRPPVMPWTMNIVSKDSIYLLDLNNARILMMDSDRNVKDTILINENSTLLPGGAGQPYVTEDMLYYVTADSERSVSAYSVDRESGELKPLIPYPDVYRKNFYGWLLMNTPYSAYNESEQKIVVGYPVDSHIYVYDMKNGGLKRYTAESRYYSPIEKISRKVDPEEEIEYFRENTTYANILYDSYRNVYYRLVEKSTPMPGVNLSNKAKKLSVMILGSDFDILGETDIPEDMDAGFRYSAFVSEEGLNIQLLTSEDELSFATYSIVTR